MLDPQEKSVFDGMVTRLRADDPAFVQRIGKIDKPRRTLRTAVAVLLWIAAPFCLYLGGWTGFFIGLVGACYGAYLVTRRTGRSGASTGPSWRSRPGATPTLGES